MAAPPPASSREALVATDGFSRITGWSAAAEELLGWSSDEACGKALDEVVPGLLPEAIHGRQRLVLRHRSGADVKVAVAVTRLQGGAASEALGAVFTLSRATAAGAHERKSAAAAAGRRRLAAQLEDVREQEQARIARDLHDELGQMLTGLQLDLTVLQRTVLENRLARQRLAAGLAEAARTVRDTMVATRRLALQLRPAALDDLGLEAAAEWLLAEVCGRHEIAYTLRFRLRDLAADARRDVALFRILQEALTNVVRHAGARRVDVGLRWDRGQLRLEVADDGRGLPPRAGATGTLGIVGMRERARACGGTLTLRRAPGGGTLVVARLPAG
jgi:signal transduction histidine kinase